MLISTKIVEKEYKSNFEKIGHMSETEIVTLLMKFATLGVPEEKQTPEFNTEIEKAIREYLNEKPKTKMDRLKEAIADANISVSVANEERMCKIAQDTLKVLIECVENVIEENTSNEF